MVLRATIFATGITTTFNSTLLHKLKSLPTKVPYMGITCILYITLYEKIGFENVHVKTLSKQKSFHTNCGMNCCLNIITFKSKGHKNLAAHKLSV